LFYFTHGKPSAPREICSGRGSATDRTADISRADTRRSLRGCDDRVGLDGLHTTPRTEERISPNVAQTTTMSLSPQREPALAARCRKSTDGVADAGKDATNCRARRNRCGRSLVERGSQIRRSRTPRCFDSARMRSDLFPSARRQHVWSPNRSNHPEVRRPPRATAIVGHRCRVSNRASRSARSIKR